MGDIKNYLSVQLQGLLVQFLKLITTQNQRLILILQFLQQKHVALLV